MANSEQGNDIKVSADDDDRSTSSSDAAVCPMCYNELEGDDGRVTAVTPCNHSACKSCLESWLLRSNNNGSVPTKGKCPICRANINLFQLVSSAADGTHLYTKNADLSISPLPGQIMIAEAGSPLAREFVSFAGEAIYFPNDCSRPFIYEPEQHAIMDEEDDESDDDDNKEGRKKYFEEGFHWHDQSCTFHGRLSWNRRFAGATGREQSDEYVDFILQVSSDLRYVSGGSIMLHRGWTPLDGTWTVSGGTEKSDYSIWNTRIEVKGGWFVSDGYNYRIVFSDHQPIFVWKDGRKEVVRAGIDSLASGSFSVGDIVEWECDNSGSRSVWVREGESFLYNDTLSEELSIGDDVTYSIREKDKLFRPIDASAEYVSGTIWGNTFVQGFLVGLASYHFISEDGEGIEGAYISYESPECSVWPTLDDGSPVPYRVPFTNIRWDVATRTFTGTIEWQSTYGCGWQGNDLWTYEMVFDRNFLCIVSGCVVSFTNGVANGSNHIYGEMLIYANYRARDRFLQDFTSVEVPSPRTGNLDVFSNTLVEEMLADGAGIRLVECVLFNAKPMR